VYAKQAALAWFVFTFLVCGRPSVRSHRKWVGSGSGQKQESKTRRKQTTEIHVVLSVARD